MSLPGSISQFRSIPLLGKTISSVEPTDHSPFPIPIASPQEPCLGLWALAACVYSSPKTHINPGLMQDMRDAAEQRALSKEGITVNVVIWSASVSTAQVTILYSI